MRRKMLVLTIIAPSMLALACMAHSQEVDFAVPGLNYRSKITSNDIATSTPSVVSAANFHSADGGESASSQPYAASPQTSTYPESMSLPQSELPPSGMTWAGGNFPLAVGPSATPFLLRYMLCDPYSCPNIWHGYDAQRSADLSAKCALPASGRGCGHCRSCLEGKGSDWGVLCTAGDCFSTAKPHNRYRLPGHATSNKGCSTCDGGVPPKVIPSSGCPSCQTQQPGAPELSVTPTILNPKS